jgi:hypothetical protein
MARQTWDTADYRDLRACSNNLPCAGHVNNAPIGKTKDGAAGCSADAGVPSLPATRIRENVLRIPFKPVQRCALCSTAVRCVTVQRKGKLLVSSSATLLGGCIPTFQQRQNSLQAQRYMYS